MNVPEDKVAKNRLHLDLRVGGRGAADGRWSRIEQTVERLVDAGATVVEVFAEHHVVMVDPEGNEFCVA